MRTVELNLDDGLSSNYFLREAFNTLRTNILFSGQAIKTIVLTSCFAHEGKTSISFDVCRSLAESGKRVLLIDADLRKSVMLSRYTNEKGIRGLSELLSSQARLDEVVCHTTVENLDIIFAGPYPPNPTELVGSEYFGEILKFLREKYDYVIVDAAPLGLVIDASLIAKYCDGAILVINIGHVKYRVAQGVKAQLQKSGCKILGVVLNQVDRKKTIGGASYSSHYMSYGSYGSYGNYGGDGESAQKAPAAPGKNATRSTGSASPTAARSSGTTAAPSRPAAGNPGAARPAGTGRVGTGTGSTQRPAQTSSQGTTIRRPASAPRADSEAAQKQDPFRKDS